jgi:hypothetical protein
VHNNNFIFKCNLLKYNNNFVKYVEKMSKYKLNFITDEDLFDHVKTTVEEYRFKIDLKKFNKNIIDPIKLTFDAAIYGKTMEDLINDEIKRQLDKSNNNQIGYFHHNIFKYIGDNWHVPTKGYDIVNIKDKTYVELKNKHNTMNSSSAQKTYIRMQNTLLKDNEATCMLVEVIAKNSQNKVWKLSLEGIKTEHERIRRVSIDKFYELVTKEKTAFKQLCVALPIVLKDVISSLKNNLISSSVFEELQEYSPVIMESLYLLAFEKYEGFSKMSVIKNSNKRNIRLQVVD